MNISVDAILTQPELRPGFGSRFEDLYQRAGLQQLDTAFLDFLGSAEAALRARLESARIEPEALARKDESELLIAVAEHLDDFMRLAKSDDPAMAAAAVRALGVLADEEAVPLLAKIARARKSARPVASRYIRATAAR